MKNIKLLSVIAALMLTTVFTFGQDTSTSAQKIGFVDYEQILGQWPTYLSAQQKLNTIQAQHEAQLKNIEGRKMKIEQKYGAINPDSITEMDRINFQSEMKALENDYTTQMQKFQAMGRNISQKQILPLINRMKKAIQEIGRKDGYTYILTRQTDPSTGLPVMIAFYNSLDLDVSDKVLLELKKQDAQSAGQ